MTRKIKVSIGWNRVRLYLSIFLLAFYLIVGGIFLFSDTWADLLPTGRYIIGIVLISFGILRFYVAYKRYQKKEIFLTELKAKLDEESK